MNASPAVSATPQADQEQIGFFAPNSVTWKVLTAPATATMIAQITNLIEIPHIDFQAVLFDHDPLFPTNRKRQRGQRSSATSKAGHFHDRLRRTVTVPLPMVFGDRKSALKTAAQLFNYHKPMTGVGADGSTPYAATSAESMLFAAVTISHAALIAYERFAFDDRPYPHRLNPVERDQYFAEMSQIAVLMGVPASDVPMSAAEVEAYYRSIAPKFTFRPGWESARLKTAATLLFPDSIKDVKATVADTVLVASAIMGYAALPRPSRRLHGLPGAIDPILTATHIAVLPMFALLRVPAIERSVLRWYIGESDREVLREARKRMHTARAAEHPDARTATQ